MRLFSKAFFGQSLNEHSPVRGNVAFHPLPLPFLGPFPWCFTGAQEAKPCTLKGETGSQQKGKVEATQKKYSIFTVFCPWYLSPNYMSNSCFYYNKVRFTKVW